MWGSHLLGSWDNSEAFPNGEIYSQISFPCSLCSVWTMSVLCVVYSWSAMVRHLTSTPNELQFLEFGPLSVAIYWYSVADESMFSFLYSDFADFNEEHISSLFMKLRWNSQKLCSAVKGFTMANFNHHPVGGFKDTERLYFHLPVLASFTLVWLMLLVAMNTH